MSTNDLQALFANIRPKSRDPSSSGTPAASAAFGFPPSRSPPPPLPTPSSPTDPTNTSSNAAQNSATAQSLLSLLNFGAAAQNSTNGTSSQQTANTTSKPEPARTVSASDLVARLVSPPAASTGSGAISTAKLEDQGGGGSGQSAEPTDPGQDALLKLLSKAQPARSSRGPSAEPQRSGSEQGKPSTPGTAEPIRTSTSREAKKSEEKSGQESKPLFTYQNPFEQLNASRQQTPKAGTPAPKPAASPIFKGLNDVPQPSIEEPEPMHETQSPAPFSARKKLTPRSVSGRLPRESSVRSNGTPEPAIKDETPAPKMEDLPVRTADDVPQAEMQEAAGAAETGAKESPQGAADEWEDAEESPAEYEPRKVPVYNFPIRPFVSLTLQLPTPSEVEIREDGVMEISRLKKEFDQLDRSLAAATTKYIAYALVKNGGMRIIRQDDGIDRQVFKHTHDRVFNVAFCTSAMSSVAGDHQAVLGTGVSGTVYYATISKEGNDLFEKNELDTESLSFPPWPPMDENTAGGALKTRAKRSSRHPEYFAIGRGKSIHIIWPANSMCSRYGVTETNRQVDMEKLYADRNLQVATGKAGKDFAFSEDDTLIVSLDKTGRLRFWDIRELTDEANATSSRVNPIKVDMPLLSLSTASPAEKSWPTSVLFVDKSRPYSRGGALRYVLVGLRQNHTLQLWDIALGKAVQELNFPHENETDGVCSVNYHPNSGIIVVGHPTRNSLFFIHLSAPRYALSSSTTQASYIQRVAAKDPEIPRPESTACMSGVREVCFASKGQLRTVELLSIHKTPGTPRLTDERAPLFELYAVHSKGVTCFTITKEDLGWDSSNKVVHGIDAAKEGVVDLKELKLGSIIEETRSKSPPEEAAPASSVGKKKRSKKHQPTVETVEEGEINMQEAEAAAAKTATPPVANGQTTQVDSTEGDSLVPKSTKRSKKKAAQATEVPPLAKTTSRTESPSKVALDRHSLLDHLQQPQPSEPAAPAPPIMSAEMEEPKSDKVSVGISGDWLDKEVDKIKNAVAKEFKKEISGLYTDIQNDRLVQDTTATSRQETVLRLVSQTLTQNVEKTLAHIIGQQMQQVVLPTLNTITANQVSGHVGDGVAKAMHHMLPRELNTHLPSAISTALSNPQLARAISESIAIKIAKQTETQMVDLANKHIIPSFKNLAVTAAEDAAARVEARLSTELRSYEAERRRDASRLAKLGEIIQGMSETLQTMSNTQVSFQGQVAENNKQLAIIAGPSSQPGSAAPSPFPAPLPAPIARPKPVKAKTQEELNQEEIADLMQQGKYEDASIKWLHSTQEQQVALFDNLFVRFTPEYLASDVSPLVAFSVGITVGVSLQTNTFGRLEWIFAAFNSVDLQVCPGY